MALDRSSAGASLESFTALGVALETSHIPVGTKKFFFPNILRGDEG